MLEICNNLKSGKACDSRCIQIEHFKYSGKTMNFLLSFLFNMIIKLEHVPSHFKQSIIIPIFKGGKKDISDCKSYRGISLQNILCKIFDKIIMMRTEHYIKSKCSLSPLQGACSQGMSSTMSAFLLQEVLTHNIERGNKVYITYFDTQTAFDCVWINGLLYKLYKYGVKGKLWKIIKKSYENCKAAVYHNYTTSNFFDVLIGVKQGGIMSMLFLYVL